MLLNSLPSRKQNARFHQTKQLLQHLRIIPSCGRVMFPFRWFLYIFAHHEKQRKTSFNSTPPVKPVGDAVVPQHCQAIDLVDTCHCPATWRGLGMGCRSSFGGDFHHSVLEAQPVEKWHELKSGERSVKQSWLEMNSSRFFCLQQIPGF